VALSDLWQRARYFLCGEIATQEIPSTPSLPSEQDKVGGITLEEGLGFVFDVINDEIVPCNVHEAVILGEVEAVLEVGVDAEDEPRGW